MPGLQIRIIIQKFLDRHDNRCQKSKNQQDGHVWMGDDETLSACET